MIRFFRHTFERADPLPTQPVDLLKDVQENLLFFKKKIGQFGINPLIFLATGFFIVTLFFVSIQGTLSFFVPYPIPSEHPIVLTGLETKRFLSNLSEENMSYQVVARVKREAVFSVEGVIVALDGDNIQIFEYPDALVAAKEVEALISQYKKPRWESSWKSPVTIYQKNALIIYYLGNHENVAPVIYKALSSANVTTIER